MIWWVILLFLVLGGWLVVMKGFLINFHPLHRWQTILFSKDFCIKFEVEVVNLKFDRGLGVVFAALSCYFLLVAAQRAARGLLLVGKQSLPRRCRGSCF